MFGAPKGRAFDQGVVSKFSSCGFVDSVLLVLELYSIFKEGGFQNVISRFPWLSWFLQGEKIEPPPS